MLRKRLTYICCFILASITLFGQQYRVCDVSSSPACVKLSDGRNVLRNIIVDGKDILKFEKFSKISLMEMKSKEIFFFSGEGEFSVEDVVSKNKTLLKSNLKAHLKDLLQGKSHSRMAGVVYKDFADSVKCIGNNNLRIADISGNIVKPADINSNEIYYFVISNTSDVPYFVNVIKTDIQGNKSVCCTSNDAMAQMDLFIPAYSTILLSAFPQMGKDLTYAGCDIVASEAPFDANAFLRQNDYIQLISPSHNSIVSYPNITVRYLIRDCNKLKSSNLLVNGKITATNIPFAEGINELEVKLSNLGKNQIELQVEDTFGNRCSIKIQVDYQRVTKPKLHILSVGIGNYKNKKIEKLLYAASDAAIIASVLDTLKILNSHLYNDGGYKMLLADNDATRGNILKCLDDIRYEADPEDIVMIYMSGHGKYVEFTSQRYFLPYDAEEDLYIESTAISYADLRAKLKQLEDKECKVIVYMDACYAGEMYFTKSASDFIGDSEPAVIGFYSSTRNQPSLEKIELKHGVFTYALLNGIKGGAGDSNGNVTISSLGDYITEQVRKESQGRQTPKVDNGGEDFILFKVSDKETDVLPVNSSNSSNSIIELAASYYTGSAIAPTTEKEFETYLAAAEMGDINSMYMTGVCYETAKGCTRNYEQAIMWYREAATRGMAAAQYNLGTMHYNGNGTPQSADIAEKWFKEADIKGYIKASAALGHLYYNKTVPEYEKAFEYFSKAALNGDAMALYYLGECYLYGNGTAEDISAALESYKKSADKGYAPAKEKLMEIDY